MKRILIDITDLELWGGIHGGTQRVVYGVAKKYYQQGNADDQTIEYIAFSSKDRAYFKTSFEPILERVEQLQHGSHQGALTAATGISLKHRLKQRIRPYIPESIRKNKAARSRARHIAVTGAKLVIATKQGVKGFKNPGVKRNKRRVIFDKQDIILILGKPWDDPNIQKVLISTKRETGLKVVQVVYDLIIPLCPHLHHPSLFKSYTQNMFEAISVSDLLLPISESTSSDLKIFTKKLNLTLPATRVIRLADQLEGVSIEESKPDQRIQNKFIACIGTIEVRKNHTLLYYTYKLALSRGIDLPQLLIVGGRGWLSDNLQYLIEHDPEIKEKFLILDNINDVGLSWIYKNCMFTVYPSIYEGWGLPVAESLAYGKFCLSSSTSSMPEIAGDLIDYFSPFDTDDCLKTISNYVEEDKLVNRTKNVVRHYKTTVWGETYKQVSGFISELS